MAQYGRTGRRLERRERRQPFAEPGSAGRERKAPEDVNSWIAVPLAGVTVLSTLAGGMVALRLARELTTAIALTGGIVVAVALFDVLPEAIEAVDDPHLVGSLVGAGFLFFFLAERALVLHHRDDDAHIHAHAQVGALGAAGLSVHSFIDGLGIGLAFGLSTETGLLVFVAVVAHDFADGLNTVGFVLRQSGDRARGFAGSRSMRRRRSSAQSSARRSRSRRRGWVSSSPSTPASSSSWAPPTSSRTRTSIRP